MSLDSLQNLSVLLLRTMGFVWLIRGSISSLRDDQGRITSSGAMAAAFFIAAMGMRGNP